ncbi:filamentous hemagglutinin N-terminal domain-containing protein [Iningainema tapete]|uniref:Filamentous hemagglutinin N-terminal domain-containing protein n=1 Tax=Iningainema tapete BLCC-T55 TaxID=2748662 RepID=A0A8J6XSB2_9CYAN|nr:filamentous hemagglutinin N-terminal domain-containing protein [Iningainema tapete]MBD2776601.1 filamentous hemagglutinin N-terminal domain-containing protein [Iningainema tapete BLCC-T55]
MTASPTVAQIVPDNTLPVNSVVTPQGNINAINGGTTAGSNLFHSFQEFSLPTGETALFNNSLNIQNIFTRITGKSVSNINGLLQANGNANVFLLNPNGIIFGPNAQLNIGGSFVASTASSIKFTDGGEFSAINPQTSLLSITVPLGLQFPPQAANIVNRSNLQGTLGKTIALVGGDITLEGSQLTAAQGRIELGSVGGNSLVSLNPTANGWTLGYGGIVGGNIQLLSQSTVSGGDVGSGNIQVQGGRVTLNDSSKITATTSGNQNGGEIVVRAKDLTVTNGSKISVETTSRGNAGSINVQADTLEVSGASANGQDFSTIAATSRGSGDSGSINITTNQLIARDGGDVSVTAFGSNSGKGGNLTVKAAESVELIGARTSPDGKNFNRSGLFAGTEGTEPGRDLTIITPKLQVLDGARVSVSTRGSGQDGKPGGQGGNLVVNAGEIELSGTSPDGRFISGLFALSGEERPNIPDPGIATGNAGNIMIQTGQLTIRDGAQVSAATVGTGKAGNITVSADTINVTGVSAISPTFPTFQTSSVPLPSSGFVNLVRTAYGFSTFAATSYGTGNSGDIEINTRQLSVSNGADVLVTAYGKGLSGTLTVNASELIELTGARAIPNTSNFSRSGLFAATEGIQNGGNLTVNTAWLVVKDGARISVSTRGPGENGIPAGKGGNLTIKASNGIDLSGIGTVQLVNSQGQKDTIKFPSGLFALSGEVRPYISETAATGQGGNLEITTGSLSIQDGAQVSVSAFGSGTAGNLQARVGSIKLKDGSITGVTEFGNGANITLQVQDSLQLRGNSQISTTAGNGNGGNITIAADAIAILNNSSIRADAGRFGGNVQITTQGLFALPSNITATSALGPQFSGIVSINTPDVESNQGLVEVPAFLALENQVAQACASEQGQNRSQFTSTGRRGLLPTATEPLSSEAVRVTTTPQAVRQQHQASLQLPRKATGWGVNSKGEVVLTAGVSNYIVQAQLPTANCHVR